MCVPSRQREDAVLTDLPVIDFHTHVLHDMDDGSKSVGMSVEMLLACVTTCDPENGAAMLEDFDSAAIAALLNEEFFPAVGGQTLRYGDIKHNPVEMTDEIRRGTLDWFEGQKDGVIAQYGEQNYQRIHDETAGYEVFVLCSYTTTGPDGAVQKDGIGKGNTNGLTFIRVRGRYYWTAFDLFDGIVVASESAEEDPELPSGELTETEEGYRYENRILGFGCDLSDDWFMVSQESPADSTGDHVDYCDLTAQKRDWTAGLNIYVEDLAVPGGVAETAEEYRDNSIPGLMEMAKEYGLTNVRIEACELSFVGQTYPGIEFFATTPSQDWYCHQIIIPSGHYLVTVTLSTYDDDWLDQLAALFVPLD